MYASESPLLDHVPHVTSDSNEDPCIFCFLPRFRIFEGSPQILQVFKYADMQDVAFSGLP